MPLWFIVVCAVMGSVLSWWLIREVYRESHPRRRAADQYWRLQRSLEEVEWERAIFEAIARGKK